jgi:hypothetical protein
MWTENPKMKGTKARIKEQRSCNNPPNVKDITNSKRPRVNWGPEADVGVHRVTPKN